MTEPTDLWRQVFAIGDGAIASGKARKRAQVAAVGATARALEARPDDLAPATFLGQLLVRGTVLADPATKTALRALVDAPWATPAILAALAGPLGVHDAELGKRARERALALAPEAGRARLAAELARSPTPPVVLADPRRAGRPVEAKALTVSRGSAEGPVTKLGGRPWLPAGVEWPACRACGEPLRFILQLAAGDGPQRRSALVSLFVCGDFECHPWSATSGANAVLLVPPGGLAPRECAAPVVAERALDLDAFTDPPDEEGAPKASWGSKTGGYPRWVQDDRTPSCAACGLGLVPVLQLDGELDEALHPGDISLWFVAICPAECSPTSGAAFCQSG